jgi:hypothetical protein
MFCTHCGTELAAGTKSFCPECGREVLHTDKKPQGAGEEVVGTGLPGGCPTEEGRGGQQLGVWVSGGGCATVILLITVFLAGAALMHQATEDEQPESVPQGVENTGGILGQKATGEPIRGPLANGPGPVLRGGLMLAGLVLLMTWLIAAYLKRSAGYTSGPTSGT